MTNLDKVRVYTDGGSRGNPGPAAVGVLVCDGKDNPLEKYSKYIGKSTNNQAEYTALIKGLEMASRYTQNRVKCVSDSELMVKQLNGEYKVKNLTIEGLFKEVKSLERVFKEVKYTHVNRTDKNIAIADKLVNEALDDHESKLADTGESQN